MMNRVRVASLVALVMALAAYAEAQPIAPFGNVPIIMPTPPPSAIMKRFIDGPAMAPVGPSPSRSNPSPPGPNAVRNAPNASPAIASPPPSGPTDPPDQRPPVCRTIEYRTICD